MKKKKRSLFSPMELVVNLALSLDESLRNVTTIDPESTEFYRRAQQGASLKKYVSATASDRPASSAAAIATFSSTICHLQRFNDLFCSRQEGENPLIYEQDQADLATARNVCLQILGPDPDMDRWFYYCKHGPNSSLGVPYWDSGTSAKWTLPLTVTENCMGTMEVYLKWDPLLVEMLERTYPCAVLTRDKLFQVVRGSRLTTVPKTDQTDRCIAIEPTANMFLQQGLGLLMSELLVPFGIDIQYQQEKHRLLAEESSITRKYATIDFSSASDCVGNELLRYLLPPKWFSVVNLVRSPEVCVEGTYVELPCIATMGNATTFVLETLVFFALAVAVAPRMNSLSRLPEWQSFKRVSVFGDDCILPSEDAPRFMELASRCGFLVNETKSFYLYDDKFRESCGADFYVGRNVRPLYLKAPRSEKPSVLRAWRYSLFNGLLKRLRSSLGDLNYVYAPALALVSSEIVRHDGVILMVEDSDPDDAGIKCFGDFHRVYRLFEGRPFLPMLTDEHGTVHYHRYESVPPRRGKFVHNIQYWNAVKKMGVADLFVDDKERDSSCYLSVISFARRPFNVLKRDRGYVVRLATNCGQSWFRCGVTDEVT